MANQECSVVGCSRPRHCRGLCKTHYEQRRKLGALDARAPVDEEELFSWVETPWSVGDKCAFLKCTQLAGPRGVCKMHSSRLRRRGLLTRKYEAAGAKLEWLRANVGYVDSKCLIWPFASTNRQGYGVLYIHPKNQSAHRVMCELVHGPAPAGRPNALHRCGNGHLGCVAPLHLRWGTAKENSADAVEHGIAIRGERSGMSKISSATALAVYRDRRHSSTVAAEHGVSVASVHAIWRGASWSWLTGHKSPSIGRDDQP